MRSLQSTREGSVIYAKCVYVYFDNIYEGHKNDVNLLKGFPFKKKK